MGKILKTISKEAIRTTVIGAILITTVSFANNTLNKWNDENTIDGDVISAESLKNMKIHWNNITNKPQADSSGKVLWSKEVYFDPDSSQSNPNNPRYVSFNVDNEVRDNCRTDADQLSRCVIEGFLFRDNSTDFFVESRMYEINYIAEGFMGAKMAFLTMFNGSSPAKNIKLSNDKKDDCEWRGDKSTWTICEKHADSNGKWITEGADEILQVSVDRQRNSSVKLFLRIVKE